MRATFLALIAPLALAACEQSATTGPQADANAAPKITMPVPSADAEPSPDLVVATWSGGQMTYGELMEEVKGRLIKAEIEYLNERYSTMRRAIDSAVNESLLEAEAKARGLADADALTEKLAAENEQVGDSEVEKFYEENKRRFRGKPLDQVRDSVKAQLVKSQQREALSELLEELREKAAVDVALDPPELPRLEVAVGKNPVRGDAGGPITIVEFADYECPYCSRGYESMQKVMSKYEGKVQWYFRDFPLSFHRNAVDYAVGAICAGEQGKYWDMHDAILDNQKKLKAGEGVAGLAKDLDLDEAAFATCMANEAHKKQVMTDMSEGQAVGVSGTPAYFINGIMISGAQPVENFEAIIDRELEAAGQAG